MAEFCLDCWNRINETSDPPEKYIISDDLDLCEGCGEWKHVIVTEKRYSVLDNIFLPFRVIFVCIKFVVILVRKLYELAKSKKQ